MKLVEDFVDSHGLVTAGADLPKRTLNRWGGEGRLVRLLPGVFCLPTMADNPATMVRAVPYWRSDAVVTGTAAARVLYWSDAPTAPVDVITRTEMSLPHYRMHRILVPPEHIVEYEGVRFTSPAWTAVWLAADDNGAALDAALRAGLSISAMDDAFATMKGFAGNQRRSEIVTWSRLKPWSQFEREVQQILVDAGLTDWVGNWPYRSRSGNQYVLDIVFRAQKVVIELDGWAFHGTRDAWLRDMRKTNDLQLDGWTVLHFSWADLERPGQMIVAILRALRQAA